MLYIFDIHKAYFPSDEHCAAIEAASSASAQVGETEGVRWKGYPCTLLHAAAFRAAKTP